MKLLTSEKHPIHAANEANWPTKLELLHDSQQGHQAAWEETSSQEF